MEAALSDYLRGFGFHLSTVPVDGDLDVVCAESALQLKTHPWGRMAIHTARAAQRPLMVLLNQASSSERAALLEMGADDCMTGHIVYRELAARLQVLVRRHREHRRSADQGEAVDRIRFGQWQLDTRRRHLLDPQSNEVSLSAAEYRLLLAFVAMPCQVIEPQELLEAARARGLDPMAQGLDSLISSLRRKLGDDPLRPRLIQAAEGQGYVFNATPPAHLC